MSESIIDKLTGSYANCDLNHDQNDHNINQMGCLYVYNPGMNQYGNKKVMYSLSGQDSQKSHLF